MVAELLTTKMQIAQLTTPERTKGVFVMKRVLETLITKDDATVTIALLDTIEEETVPARLELTYKKKSLDLYKMPS